MSGTDTVYAHAYGANTVLALFAVLRWIFLGDAVMWVLVSILLRVGEWDAVVCSDVLLIGLALITVLRWSILRLCVVSVVFLHWRLGCRIL
jgi:hypothetical protein